MMLLLPTIFSILLTTNAAFLFGENGIVLPKSPHGFVGDVVKLTCNVTDPVVTGNVSGYMYFTKVHGFEDRVIPLQYIKVLSTRSIRLEYPIRSQEEQGSYVCHLNTTDGQYKILGNQYVMVDYHVKAVESISCQVYDWQNMTCTWDLGVDYINSEQVTVQLVWTIIGAQYDCPHPTKTSCSWHKYDGIDSFHPGQTYYMVILVKMFDRSHPAKKIDEAKSKNFIISTNATVKPAPVEKLRVFEKNSTCMSIRWHHQRVSRTLSYRLQLGHWRSSRQQFQTYKIDVKNYTTVCGLHPATDYTIRVSSIPCDPVHHGNCKVVGEYSKWSTIIDRTPEDVPNGVPGLRNGSIAYKDCSNHMSCRVTLYWQPISEKDSNGQITHYRILQTEIESGETTELLVSGLTYNVDLDVNDDLHYQIEVAARTRIGFSVNSASLVIVARKERPAYKSDLLVEAHTSLLRIIWNTPVETIGRNLGYTLYFCNGSKFTLKCQDEIQWLHLGPDQTTFDWKLSDSILDNKMIGISVELETANGKRSSGIQWNMCIYLADKKPPKLKKFRFSPEQPDNALRVEWEKFDCTKTPVYVSHYQLSYCKVNSQNGCAGPTENLTVHNKEASHMIKGLMVGVSYRVTMHAVSQTGIGPESDPIIHEVVNSDLSTGALIGICFASIIVVGIAVILCYRKLRHVKKDMYLQVDYPSIATLPPLIPGESLQDQHHHYVGRPLPQVPSSTGHPTTGPDDGYSSADTDPSFDPMRAYEPIGKGVINTKGLHRNISISSETALLIDDQHHQLGMCSPYKITQLTSCGGNSDTIDKLKKRYVNKAHIRQINMEDISRMEQPRTDNSTGLSYTKFAITGYTVNGELTEGASLFNNESQVGFVFSPQNVPPSDCTLSDPTQLGAELVPTSTLSEISYATNSFARPYLDATVVSDVPSYTALDFDGNMTPSPIRGYVAHEDAATVGMLCPGAATSTPDGHHGSVRPLSDYMKHLPLSYFEEPKSDVENCPTTEL